MTGEQPPTPCTWCDGTCDVGDVTTVDTAELRWLWEQLAAAADRFGPSRLRDAATNVEAPASPAARAAAKPLVGRLLTPGRKFRVDPVTLSERVARVAGGATLEAVVAHAVGRRPGERHTHQADARARRDILRSQLAAASDWPEIVVERVWSTLSGSGWVSRLVARDDAELVVDVIAAADQLVEPGDRNDRRLVAQELTGDPHALDDGLFLAGVCLAALLARHQLVPSGRSRVDWDQVGVVLDEIVGGLTIAGFAPTGWTIPKLIPVTLPPRVLSSCEFGGDLGDVFVVENPSVLTAALDQQVDVPVVSLNGTPSAVEVGMLARLSVHARLRVRADFDAAGVAHVATVLTAAPSATPWRMTAADYRDARAAGGPVPLTADRLPDTFWDPALRDAMLADGHAAFEEALLGQLVADMKADIGK